MNTKGIYIIEFYITSNAYAAVLYKKSSFPKF